MYIQKAFYQETLTKTNFTVFSWVKKYLQDSPKVFGFQNDRK